MYPAESTESRLQASDYRSELKPVWCPGCGHYGVLAGMSQAFARLQLKPENTLVVSGIGCSSRIPGYLRTYGFNSVHGRALPIAMGAKLANPELEVIAAGGDGDGFSIGIGHFPHLCRRNINITYIVMDNCIYGLTKGQLSPTSPGDMVTTTTRYGNIENPIDPISFAVGCGATFVARSFAGDIKHVAEMVVAGIEHQGFSFIQVLSPCVTFVGKEQFPEIKRRLHYLEDDLDYDFSKRCEAFKVVDETDRISVGVIYRQARPTYTDKMRALRKKLTEREEYSLENLLNLFRP